MQRKQKPLQGSDRLLLKRGNGTVGPSPTVCSAHSTKTSNSHTSLDYSDRTLGFHHTLYIKGFHTECNLEVLK